MPECQVATLNYDEVAEIMDGHDACQTCDEGGREKKLAVLSAFQTCSLNHIYKGLKLIICV